VAYAPENHFHFPLKKDFKDKFPYRVYTAHGPYPRYRDPASILCRPTHYGRKLKISIPIISTAAKILYFAIIQLRKYQISSRLYSDRAQAIENGDNFVRPTQEDVIELNTFKFVQFSPATQWDWWVALTPKQLQLESKGVWHHGLKADSARHDFDWQRLTRSWDPWHKPPKSPLYKVGSLNGLWHGRMLVRIHFPISSARFNMY
jgi:hypothetical protein